MKLPTGTAYVPQSKSGHLADLAAQPRFLLPLKLHAAGTADVEAATSYASRVATEHGVGIRQIPLMLLRLLKANYVVPPTINDLYTINGTGRYAEVFIDLLRGATVQQNVALGSLYHLRNVLSPMKSNAVRVHRRWCSDCLAEMRESETGPYMRLIWQIGLANDCERHGTQLCEVCPSCGSRQLQLCSLLPLDRCAKCGSDLCGNTAKSRSVSAARASEIAWINKNLCELILAANAPFEIADNAFCRFIKTLVAIYGTEGVVLRLRGYCREAINQWARSRCQSSLATLLDVCAKTNVPASLIIREPEIAATSCQELDLTPGAITYSFCKEKVARHPRKKRDRESANRRATELLARLPRGEYVSHERFATKLKLPVGTAEYLISTQLRQLNRRNNLIRRREKDRKRREALRVVRRVVKQIVLGGGIVSRHQVLNNNLAKSSKISRTRFIAAYASFRSQTVRLRPQPTRRAASSKSSGARPHLQP